MRPPAFRRLGLVSAAAVLACCTTPTPRAPAPPVTSTSDLFIGNEKGVACIFSLQQDQAFAGVYETVEKSLTLTVGRKVGAEAAGIGIVAILARRDVPPGLGVRFATGWPVTLTSVAVGGLSFSETASAGDRSALTGVGWPARPTLVGSALISGNAPLAAWTAALASGEVRVGYRMQQRAGSVEVWQLPALERAADLDHLRSFVGCMSRIGAGPVDVPAPVPATHAT